ncbi:MAG: L-rhamnose mutarotase [Rhizobiales bacterium]|nr:L-rhamnose mutarotase [Hyphomicrobiales bacterium]NRB15451.1 L-rhamnose mutarotase [Hyphomicrobiales bacterium]
MKNYAWVLEVRTGYEDEYKKRHDEIWPEMVEEITASGIRNYSIFRHGLTLIGYFETDDLKKTIAYLAQSDANRRWGEYMGPLMKIEVDESIGFPYLLPLQWHMD